MPSLPNSDLVGQAWLAAYSSIPAAAIAATLPADLTKWLNHGFLQVRALPGGTANIELAERRSTVLQLDGFGARSVQDSDTMRPMWGVAFGLIEAVRKATFASSQSFGKPVTMPIAGYSTARVLAGYLVSEPVRVENDPSGYARVMTNLALDWTV